LYDDESPQNLTFGCLAECATDFDREFNDERDSFFPGNELDNHVIETCVENCKKETCEDIDCFYDPRFSGLENIEILEEIFEGSDISSCRTFYDNH